MHHDDSNVIFKPIIPLSSTEMVEYVHETELPVSAVLSSLDAAIIEMANSMGDEFVRQLIDALVNSDPELPARRFAPMYVGPVDAPSEYVCRKHKHQGWCARMKNLVKYTRIAINYHHTKKRLRNNLDLCPDQKWSQEDRHTKLVYLYEELRSEARIRFYSTECTCPGLGTTDAFETIKPRSVA